MILKFNRVRAVVKISSSCVQTFMSYFAYREKKFGDENNTVRRYREDSNYLIWLWAIDRHCETAVVMFSGAFVIFFAY